ncbi:hypothetical protein FB381_0770 [Nocardioides albertanoniae]|uniref:Uncharacterized protein n=1 Tax=Nocardioides albertanoniae TaxID=1175486 RepID=A0A543A2V4_9ACTN|nr:hypothetical protein [Nocardioides albertanoniae]TQL66901.1 hypothetical protein FB381_0770 [Nocardioides albertanoniae]
MSEHDVATADELAWASDGGSAALVEQAEQVLAVLSATGRTPEEADVDVLRAAAFLLVSQDRIDDVGRGWLELLDAVRAHPDAALADLPPARTD